MRRPNDRERRWGAFERREGLAACGFEQMQLRRFAFVIEGYGIVGREARVAETAVVAFEKHVKALATQIGESVGPNETHECLP